MPAPIGNQYAKGHGYGRPSEYRPEYVEDVYNYIQESIDKYRETEEVELPTREGFANRLGVVNDTLKNWAEKNKDFLASLRYLDNYQKNDLINKGLSSKYNSTIAKLILSANHGMREGSDITSKGEKIEGITFEVIKNETENENQRSAGEKSESTGESES